MTDIEYGRTVDSYESIARLYAGDEPAEDDPELRRKTRQAFIDRVEGSPAGHRILEVGCGPGVDAKRLSEAGLDVLATDACRSFIDIVRQRYPELDARVADMTALEMPQNSFDGVYGFASFIHLPRELGRPTLEGFERILRPGGVLYLTMLQSESHDQYVIDEWGGKSDNPARFTCWDQNNFRELLTDVGFRDIEFLHIKSEVYDNSSRLDRYNVTRYHVAARAAPDA